jgi:hypothetical protein
MAILERQLPKDYFNDNRNYLPFILLLGIVSVGVSLGILLGALLKSLQISVLSDFIFPFSIFLFLGISLIVSYFILKTIQKKL